MLDFTVKMSKCLSAWPLTMLLNLFFIELSTQRLVCICGQERARAARLLKGNRYPFPQQISTHPKRPPLFLTATSN